MTPAFQIQSSVLTFFDSLSAFRSHPLYDLNQIPYDYTVKVTNRFKGLDLTDRVSKELWMEVCNTVQEAVTKTIPKEKKCKKAEWLSEVALQIAEKIRKVKRKDNLSE